MSVLLFVVSCIVPPLFMLLVIYVISLKRSSNEQNDFIWITQRRDANERMRATEHQVPDITGIYKTERPLVNPQEVFNTPIYIMGETTTEVILWDKTSSRFPFNRQQ